MFQYMSDFIDDLPSEVFDHLMSHMSQCAFTYRMKVEGEHRKTTLNQLFVSCDHAKVQGRCSTSTVEPVLKDHSIGHTNVVSQETGGLW